MDPLTGDIHLLGWDTSYTQAEVRELIRAYVWLPILLHSGRPEIVWRDSWRIENMETK